MPRRRDVDADAIRRAVDVVQVFEQKLVEGAVATDGVVYSPAILTNPSAPLPYPVLTKLIDPGVDLRLTNIEVGLTQRWDNLNAAQSFPVVYGWHMRNRSGGTIGSWITLGTFSKTMPTHGVTGDPFEDTHSSYVSVATMPEAPLELKLEASVASGYNLTGEVKNSSYIKLIGIVIPGS